MQGWTAANSFGQAVPELQSVTDTAFMFTFNDFLNRMGLAPDQVRLLRHDIRGMAAWRRGGATAFGCFASFQKRQPAPYKGVEVACHFLPGPSQPDGTATALYIGTTRILDQWVWDGQRLPRLRDDTEIAAEAGNRHLDAFDLEWLETGQAYAERVLVHWGQGTRAWSQWANRNPKPILELRLHAQEPTFPGFSGFVSRIGHIPQYPQSWVAALESVTGIYLLITDTGEQYVGSATGQRGFLGRWRNYLANGHGGNLLLQRGGQRDYAVTILEIASPDMSAQDILARESIWKAKLGARAHGLNAN